MKHPWMPLFWGDFLANTLHLSAQEVGAYFLLIAHAWEHDAQIPFKDARRIARVRHGHWARVFAKLEPFFEWEKDPRTGAPVRGTHTRVHLELLRTEQISNKRKGAALQMHANKHASALHPPSQPLKESFSDVSKSGNGVQMHRRPEPTAAWHPRVDEADDYRSPPAKKSDNTLQPIPEKTERRQ